MRRVLNAFRAFSFVTILQLTALLACGLIVIFSVLSLINALQHGIAVSTFPTDGTFQLYNPLRRLDAGQHIGSDFPFFHGVGVPWLHFPVYKLLGSNIFAAETAKWLVIVIIFVLSTVTFFYSYFRSLSKTLVASALFITGSMFFIDVIAPGGSLRGLRSAFPIFVAAALIWQGKSYISIRWLKLRYNELVAILLIGLSYTMGTEHGVASTIAYACTLTLLHRRKGIKKWIVELFLKLSLVAVATLALLTVFTGGHPLEALRYMFMEVPKDQSWYFGAPPNPYLSVNNLLPGLFIPGLLPLWIITIFGAAMGFYASWLKDDPRLKYITVLFLMYGVVVFAGTVLGYYIPAVQLVPLERAMGLVLALGTVELVFGTKPSSHHMHTKLQIRTTHALRIVSSLAIAAPIVYGLYHVGSNLSDINISSVIRIARHDRNSEDYTSLNTQWKARIDSFRPYLSSDKTLWSTYSGAYEGVFHRFSQAPGGEDYIIHALGDERRNNYLSGFIQEKPYYVTTLRPDFFYYEEWLWGTSGDFYHYLFTHYELIDQNDSHYLWRILEEPVAQNTEWETAPTDGNRFYLPPTADKLSVYQVDITYSAGSSIKPLSNIPRYLLSLDGVSMLTYPVSVPHYKNEVRLIIPIAPSDAMPSISAQTAGIPALPLFSIDTVRYRPLQLPEDSLTPFLDNACAPRNVTPSICSKARD